MIQKITFVFLSLLFFSNNTIAQEKYPGGVSGAEAWYIIDYYDLDNYINANHSLKEIKIKSCNDPLGEKSLFNFNHSVSAQNLCLFYNSPLENTTSRNVFFVGRQVDQNYNYSHVNTQWNGSLSSMFPGDSVRNRFDVSTNASYFNRQLSSYTSVNNANINFYHLNMYQTDRKFKSYGLEGETTFYIGKAFINPATQAESFSGNFPEFISFPFELTANQKNRVESYLALKYGITLDKTKSYRNSKNVIFWNSRNNSKFGNRIFGIGKDDISGLNQLQSNTEHDPGFLITAVEDIEDTNFDKQQLVTIANNHFIVFGDNDGGVFLETPNAHNVAKLNRKWLSQNTGKNSSFLFMNFKIKLEGEMANVLSYGGGAKLWMLHHKQVTNQQVSDFNSQYVEYYEADHLDGFDFGYFNDVFFDTDGNIYDQYTFGVGPEMIVQVRFDSECNPSEVAGNVVVTGGRAPYNITITNPQGYYLNTVSYEKETDFSAPTSYTYTVEVTDSLNNYATLAIDIPVSQIELDLGPDQILSASQPQVVLDANSYSLNDTDATYKWSYNGEVIEHYDPTLTVNQPGEYSVEVASANRACVKTDSIVISYNFIGTTEQILDCNAPGTISLKLQGGVAPYSTVISGGGQTIYEVHATDDTIFTDISYGLKTITVTDSNQQVFQTTINVLDLGVIPLNIADQMSQVCEPYYDGYEGCTAGISYPLFVCDQDMHIFVDASALVANPNVLYQWYVDGVLKHVGATAEIYQDYSQPGNGCGWPEITVVATNLNSNCITSETVGAAKFYRIVSTVPSTFRTDNTTTAVDEQNDNKRGFETKVYPNPSESGATFYYEVTSGEAFNGTVEIFSPTGALLRQEYINGQASYTLPFELTTSGVYLICTKTNGKILTDKIIIK